MDMSCPHTYLLQFIHKCSQSSQSVQITAPPIGHTHQTMKRIIHTVIQVRGHCHSSPTKRSNIQLLCTTVGRTYILLFRSLQCHYLLVSYLQSGAFCANPDIPLARPASQAPPLCCSCVSRWSVRMLVINRLCLSTLRGTFWRRTQNDRTVIL